MRNLKKILALVLAMVMVVGVLSVATAATPGTSYSDDASITTYDEAVQVLDQLHIYRGNEKGEFMPNSSITRAEVAALVYRIVHQDVTDKYVGIYADYNKFADVDEDDWFAGYVNYCANGEYIVGDGNGNFIPEGEVNGYQVLAIMLRALGYDREGEFQGTGWEIRTARKAKELGITANITEGTLGAPASRELVAELIFKAMLCETQDWSLAYGYESNKTTLGYETFKLGTERSDVELDGIYDEPIAYYAVGSNAKAIEIRFNPIAKYTDGVTSGTLYTLLSALDTTPNYYVPVNCAVDGTSTSGYVVYGDTSVVAGRGAVAEVFVVDGEAYVVVKNTYVDTVATTYNSIYGTFFTLTNATLDANYVTKTLPVGSKVIFNMYNGVADTTTVKAAESKAVTVTNTYVSTLAKSYILVGGTKYVYDCNYADLLGADVLDRDAEDFVATQTLYFDEYGYVIYTEDTDSTNDDDDGYLLIVNSTYGGYLADNGYVNTFTAYTMDGQKVTVKGAEGAYCYSSKDDAADYVHDIGIYNYTKNENGLYKLEKVEGTWTYNETTGLPTGSAGVMSPAVTEILAGDADAMGASILSVLNDNTIFVVANYNKNGLISGYSVVTGFKNINDLSETLGNDMNGNPIEMVVEYVSNVDSNYFGVDFVFVKGAAQSDADDDCAESIDLFYMVNDIPEKYVTTYDTHTVIHNGQAGTIKVEPGLVAAKGITSGDFFTVEASAKKTGIATDLELVAPDYGVYYAAAGVLYVSSTGEFITMADNCTVYNISGSTVTKLAAADVAWIGWTWGYNAAYGMNTVLPNYYDAETYEYTNSIVVAETNDYGYATVIYLVDGV